MSLHRITIPGIILRDYEKRGVFPRHHYGTHPMIDDICPLLGAADMAALLNDAEQNILVRVTGNPKLSMEYHRLTEKLRRLLRKDESEDPGRDGKSAAAGD